MVVLLASFSFLDYHTYIRETADHPSLLPDILAGRGLAPQQYRIAVPLLAQAVHRVSHLSFETLFALIDLLCGLGAALAIRRSLTLTPEFRSASLAGQFARLATLSTLILFYFFWCLRYQRPDTIPCALFLCLAAVLLSSRSPLALPGLLGLSLLQGFVRSDIAITLNVGLFLAALFGAPLPGTLRRLPTLLASTLGALASLLILLWLARSVYPHATYGSTAVVQLRTNVSGQLLPFTLFLLPILFGILCAMRSRPRDSNLYLVVGGALFLFSWFLLGRAQEVRIFAPYAIVLIPLAVFGITDRLLGETSEVTA